MSRFFTVALSPTCPSCLFVPQQSLSVKGTEALDLTLSFDEKLTLLGNLNYLTRSLDVRIGAYQNQTTLLASKGEDIEIMHITRLRDLSLALIARAVCH